MNFRTIVTLPKNAPQLSSDISVLSLGSCFADHIGDRIKKSLPEGQVCINPFGVLYNPESIRIGLEILLYGSLFFPENFMFQGRDQLWHSWLHSSHYSAVDYDICKEKILRSYNLAADLLRKANLLCITFGTNHAYLHKKQGYIVGNCHKEVPQTFGEQILKTQHIVESWTPLLNELHRENSSLQIIFTLSPYRYAKYGFHENQIAKSHLLLAIDELCHLCKNVIYFPAYEIVNDELRDYRFYDADMLHPTEQTIEYIWERFSSWCFSSKALREMEMLRKQHKREEHRPLIK